MNRFLAAASGAKVRRTFDDDFHTTTLFSEGKAVFSVRTSVCHVKGIKGGEFKAESCLSSDFLNELRGYEEGSLDYLIPAMDAVIRPAIAEQYSLDGQSFYCFETTTPIEILEMATKYHKGMPVDEKGDVIGGLDPSAVKILLRENVVGLDFEYDIGRVEVGLNSFEHKLAFASALDYRESVDTSKQVNEDYLKGLPDECEPTDFVVPAKRKVEAAMSISQSEELRDEVRQIKSLTSSRPNRLAVTV